MCVFTCGLREMLCTKKMSHGRHGLERKVLYSFHFFAFHLWPFGLPFVSKHGKEHITHQHREAKTPNQSDGIEEIGIA